MTEGQGDILREIPDVSKTGWKTKTINLEGGEAEIKPLLIKSHHVKLGVDVSYGQGPDGYDQWVIREPHGGGSVTIPYLWINGELYIGANRQKRSLTGGLVTEVPRGFSLPHETHEETAKREFQEETGVIKPLAERIEPLHGKPVNPNTAFFQANPHKGEGVKLFGLKVEPNEVQIRRNSEDPRRRVYKFTPELQGEIKELNEKIKPEGIRFFHSSLLSQTSDGFTLQAIARLATE
jgi:8-oxo-dGTP pyrophosphatase MutT (NUDIX family)